jgi:8-oxo-dGTP diphosphatase
MSEIIQHASSSNAASAVVRVGVGCFVIDPVNHPSQFLVGTRRGSHGAGKLALPGGHLEMNESWESCAAREVFEETNLSVHKLHLFTVTVGVVSFISNLE